MIKPDLCGEEKDRKDKIMFKKFSVFLLALVLLSGCSSEDASGSSQINTENKSSSEPAENSTQKVSLCAVGDNLIHETIYEEADSFSGEIGDGKYDFSPFYSEVKSDIESYDLAFINQETIVGGSELGLSGYPVFNSPYEVAEAVKDTGFDMVNMATNHALDMGQQGIDNAVLEFDKLNICHDGVYKNEQEKNSVSVIEKNGIKFSLVSFTESTNGISPPNSYSISTFDDDEYIKQKIKKAKSVSDVVIVSAHWGTENSFETNDFQEYYSQFLADCGADIIIGTHPHTIQPIEWVDASDGRKVICAYSLGNFLGGMLSADNVLSGLLSLDVTKNENEITVDNVKWTPLVIHFEGNQNNIQEDRSGYKIYKLSDYTNELADNHVLNGYDGNVISIKAFKNKTNSVISKEFLI